MQLGRQEENWRRAAALGWAPTRTSWMESTAKPAAVEGAVAAICKAHRWSPGSS